MSSKLDAICDAAARLAGDEKLWRVEGVARSGGKTTLKVRAEDHAGAIARAGQLGLPKDRIHTVVLMDSGSSSTAGMVRGDASVPRMPLPGHSYHHKTDSELLYIIRDASQAARAMQGHDSRAEGKYLDQANDAQTILNWRRSGGARLDSVSRLDACVAAADRLARGDAEEYWSRASAKGGRKLGEYGPHPDREAAQKEAWSKHPNARQVSTSRGQYGMDIRWHRKEGA